jgi:hypothetical protein
VWKKKKKKKKTGTTAVAQLPVSELKAPNPITCSHTHPLSSSRQRCPSNHHLVCLSMHLLAYDFLVMKNYDTFGLSHDLLSATSS